MNELNNEQDTIGKPVDTDTIDANTSEDETSSIGNELSNFIEQIFSLLMTFIVTSAAVIKEAKEADEKADSSLEMAASNPDSILEKPVHEQVEFFHKINERTKQVRIYTIALRTIPRSYLINIISYYDVFLGNLIKIILSARPEIFNISEKNLTFAQLVEFGSIENAKNFILEKEVEGLLRKSHVDQFTWMETKFNIPLRKELDIWPSFVEITERRNLFVHTGGIVSSQYIKVCNENNVPLEGIKVGEQITESKDYYVKAHKTIFELAFKLAHVLWRKFLPYELEEADLNLINIGYDDALSKGHYDLTKIIFDFGTQTLKKWSNEENRLIMVINRALGYKWSGDNKKANKIISQEDWSATKTKFRLAAAVIQDRYEIAYNLMRELGNNGNEINMYNYRTWPLFKAIKKEEKFLEVFQEIFGEAFEQLEFSSIEVPEIPEQNAN